MFQRGWNLHLPELWVDEAESAINALTILDGGFPIDHYMGMPIYENTLVRPWPESEEYEFKDISYSSKGLAIYHGWLPLYSIAASLNWFGIEPDPYPERMEVRHGPDAFEFRTWVPRVPSILFGAVFLAAVFLLGRAVHGTDAGLAMLFAASVTKVMIYLGRQARYYSLTLALSALCGLFIWRAANRGLWRDYLTCGIVFILLFHTHILSFFILGLVMAAMLPWIWAERRMADAGKIAAMGALAFAGVFPWMVAAGFLETAEKIPPAWPLFSWIHDLKPLQLGLIAICAAGVGWWLWAVLPANRAESRYKVAFSQHTKAFYFATFWLMIAYFSFLFIIPAASYFTLRLKLVTAVPGLLLLGIVLATFGEAITKRKETYFGLAAMAAVLLVTGRLTLHPLEKGTRFYGEVAEIMRQAEFAPGAKLYATPNDHLPLTYYTGLPVQSVAPVRKSFIGEYPGDIVVFEAPRYNILSPEEIQAAAEAESGAVLEKEAADRWREFLYFAPVLEDVTGHVANPFPPMPPIGPFERSLIEAQRQKTREAIARSFEIIPIMRGENPPNWFYWWPIFFYRYVDYEARIDENLNYAARMADAAAFVTPRGWVILASCGNDCLGDIKRLTEYPSPPDESG